MILKILPNWDDPTILANLFYFKNFSFLINFIHQSKFTRLQLYFNLVLLSYIHFIFQYF